MITFRFFRQQVGFLAVTDQCPKGFQGVVFIAYAGDKPETVKEVAVAPNQVTGIEVNLHDMPVEWLKAFGCPVPKPKPEPEPKVSPKVKVRHKGRGIPSIEIVVTNGIRRQKATPFEMVVMVIAAAVTLYVMLLFC